MRFTLLCTKRCFLEKQGGGGSLITGYEYISIKNSNVMIRPPSVLPITRLVGWCCYYRYCKENPQLSIIKLFLRATTDGFNPYLGFERMISEIQGGHKPYPFLPRFMSGSHCPPPRGSVPPDIECRNGFHRESLRCFVSPCIWRLFGPGPFPDPRPRQSRPPPGTISH